MVATVTRYTSVSGRCLRVSGDTGHPFPADDRRRDAGYIPYPVGLRMTAFRGQFFA